MSSYGERFRMIRKGMHQTIGTAAALRKYHVLEESEARRLMSRLLQDSEDLADHIRKLVTYASELNLRKSYRLRL